MRNPIDGSLRRISEELQKNGEDTVQTPMPWHFLELLCQLDEKEEAATRKADDAERDRLKWLLRRGRGSKRHLKGRVS